MGSHLKRYKKVLEAINAAVTHLVLVGKAFDIMT